MSADGAPRAADDRCSRALCRERLRSRLDGGDRRTRRGQQARRLRTFRSKDAIYKVIVDREVHELSTRIKRSARARASAPNDHTSRRSIPRVHRRGTGRVSRSSSEMRRLEQAAVRCQASWMRSRAQSRDSRRRELRDRGFSGRRWRRSSRVTRRNDRIARTVVAGRRRPAAQVRRATRSSTSRGTAWAV